jgi:hypothetical protein
VPNVTGDLLASLVVARSEGVRLDLSLEPVEFETVADAESDLSAQPVLVESVRD